VDEKALLKALKENRRLALRTVITVQGRLTSGARGGALADSELAALDQTDVFVLDGVAETQDAAEVFSKIRDRIRQGGAGLVIAGPGADFGPNLAALVPLDSLAPAESGSFTPVTTSEGRNVPWFDPQTGIDLAEVPPFAGMVAGRPKPGRTAVWLSAQETGMPLLALGRSGAGRVVFLTGFPLWRWGFMAGVQPDKPTPLQLVLDGVLGYLTEEETTRFRLEPEKPGFLSGEEVRFRLTARTPDGAPWSGLDAVLRIDSGRVLIPMVAVGPGRYEVTVPAPSPGEYEAEAELRLGSAVVGRPTTTFLVAEQSIELAQLGLNRGLLFRIAQNSGGRFYLSDSLPKDGAGMKLGTYQRRLVLEPRRTWWLFALVALVAGVEIVLRRRKGLL